MKSKFPLLLFCIFSMALSGWGGQFRFAVRWLHNRYTFAPGSPVEFRIVAESLPADGRFEALLLDSAKRLVWRIPANAGGGGIFSGKLPDLRSGRYTLGVLTAGGEEAVAGGECFVVDPFRREDFFPMVYSLKSQPAVAGISPDELAAIRASGFNVVGIPPLPPVGYALPTAGQAQVAQNESWLERLGLAVAFEGLNYSLYRSARVHGVCPFSPEFGRGNRAYLDPLIDVANRVPHLETVQLANDPRMKAEEHLWDCPHCRREFLRRYSFEVPEDRENIPVPYRRWALGDFSAAVVDQILWRSRECIAGTGNENWKSLLSCTTLGLGYQRPRTQCQDVVLWSGNADCLVLADSVSGSGKASRLRMLRQTYSMSYLREISRQRQISWGRELSGKNSVEQAFAAIAHGAGFLRLDAASLDLRQRKDMTRALRVIGRAGPLLKKLPPAPDHLAVLHPNAEELIENGYRCPDHLFALLKTRLGSVTVLPETVAILDGQISQRSLFLVKVKYLHADFVPILFKWMEQGGILYCDSLPEMNHLGEKIPWPEISSEINEFGAYCIHFQAFGNGGLVCFEAELESELEDLVENEPSPASLVGERLESLFAILVRTAGQQPIRIRCDAAEGGGIDGVTTGIRANEDAFVLTVVNHRDHSVWTDLAVDLSGISSLRDLETGGELSMDKTEFGFSTRLKLPARQGRIFVGYRKAPASFKVEVETKKTMPGKNLEYEVSINRSWGWEMHGPVLVEVQVKGPDGVVVDRFGGRFAVDGDRSFRFPVPRNALRGRYEIFVSSPQIKGKVKRAAFEIPQKKKGKEKKVQAAVRK